MENKIFEVTEIRPKIFLMKFKNAYDMNMHFLRYSEFTDCVSDKFRGKSFKILDYMEWYSKEYGNGIFSYVDDFSGHDILGVTIKDVFTLGISDFNLYDSVMLKTYNDCYYKYRYDFVLLGTYGKNEALKHEIAHGFFFLNKEYRDAMISLVDNLPKNIKNCFKKQLKKLCYSEEVFHNEVQAFLATGWKNIFYVPIKNEDKPFKKLFKEFYKNEQR